MAFNIDKFISDMFGNSKSDNNTNASKRIIKKKDDGGKAALRASQNKDNAKRMINSKGQGYSGTGVNSGTTKVRTGPKRSTLLLTDGAGIVNKSKDNLKDRKIALRAKKEKEGIDKAYNRSSALSIIKKDTNLVGNKKASNKKVIVTKAQLEKSGLSLRDYMNMLKSKETGRKISRDSRFDKKEKSPSTNSMKNTFSNDVGKSTKIKKNPSKMNPNKANEFASLKKMTNTVKKNKDGKMVIKKNKQGKYVIKKGY